MIDEWSLNQRRNWKAEVFPYDYYIPDFTKECLYCLTEKQAEILRGIVTPIAWQTRWWSESDATVEKHELQLFRDDIIRRLMMSCCGDDAPIQFRWTEDGQLERSEDGGATWTPAPEFDPRNNSTVFPPVAGEPSSDKRCISATGMTNLIKVQVGDNLTDGMTSYTLSQLIADWLHTLIGTSSPFEALITIAVNQIFALVIATLRPALTETVYHLLTCIFYCRMKDDLSFDNSRVNLVTDDIGAQIGGISTLFLQQLVNLLGAAGMTNLARSQSVTSGDCSDCAACPSNCDPSGWTVGLWYADVLYDETMSSLGTFVSAGDDYIIAQSTDRGDGQEVIGFTVNDRVTCCTIQPEFVGGVPDSTLHFYNTCPAQSSYETKVQDEIGSPCRSGTFWYFQMTPNAAHWQVKFKFVDGCP